MITMHYCEINKGGKVGKSTLMYSLGNNRLKEHKLVQRFTTQPYDKCHPDLAPELSGTQNAMDLISSIVFLGHYDLIIHQMNQ